MIVGSVLELAADDCYLGSDGAKDAGLLSRLIFCWRSSLTLLKQAKSAKILDLVFRGSSHDRPLA